jgi:hypothetical protein
MKKADAQGTVDAILASALITTPDGEGEGSGGASDGAAGGAAGVADGKGTADADLATIRTQLANVQKENDRLKADMKTASEKRDGAKSELEKLQERLDAQDTATEAKLQKVLDAKIKSIPENLRALFENEKMKKLPADERLELIADAEAQGLFAATGNPSPRDQVDKPKPMDLEKLTPIERMRLGREYGFNKSN